MAREHAVIIEESLRIPADALTFDRKWVQSPGFPETGRIDYLAGDIEVDMSPEDLHTHGIVKVAFTSTLYTQVTEQDFGEVFTDRTRVVSRSRPSRSSRTWSWSSGSPSNRGGSATSPPPARSRTATSRSKDRQTSWSRS